jgi:hypothetical protein
LIVSFITFKNLGKRGGEIYSPNLHSVRFIVLLISIGFIVFSLASYTVVKGTTFIFVNNFKHEKIEISDISSASMSVYTNYVKGLPQGLNDFKEECILDVRISLSLKNGTTKDIFFAQDEGLNYIQRIIGLLKQNNIPVSMTKESPDEIAICERYLKDTLQFINTESNITNASD